VKTVEVIDQINAVGESIPIKVNSEITFWVLILLNIIIIAIVKTINSGYIRSIFTTVIHNRALVNNIREDLNMNRFSSIILNLTYFNSLAIIIWIAIQNNTDSFLLILLGILTSIAIFKLIVIRFIAFISGTNIGLKDHLLSHLVYYQIVGVISTPILIFTRYIPENYSNLLWISLFSIIGLMVLIRDFQSLIRALQYNISPFYIILYLCTLEILPLVVGFRILIPK